MKNTPSVKAILVAAGLTLGASGLVAAPQGKYPQSTSGPQASTSATPSQAEPQNWIEQHLKGKTGRYSGAEEARLEDVKNSTAFRAEAAPVSTLTAIEQRRKVKQGQ